MGAREQVMGAREQGTVEREQGGAVATAAGATRIRFRERQLLRADDLAAEQAYHVAMRRRHHTALHGWGIVRGLRLLHTPGGVEVEAGMAVDGYGRELFIAAPLAIPEDSFERLESTALDAWLIYDRVEETTQVRGRFACGTGRHSRWREISRLRLTPARRHNPRAPAEVPDDDLSFAAHETPTDDPAREWPVYLGTIVRTENEQIVRRESIDPADELPRPAVKLVGEKVAAPSGRARVRVGSELASESQRFSVSLPDAHGTHVEHLSIDRAGRTTVRGNARLGDNLLMRKGADAQIPSQAGRDHCSRARTRADEELAARAVIFRPPVALPAEAAPWQIYRTTITRDKKQVRQLRVEVAHPGDDGDPRLNKLAVGHSEATGEFTSCLTVTADCLVTIVGDLKVNGQLIEGAIKADPTDPRFGAELLNQWSKGVAAAKAQLPNVFPGGGIELEVTVESVSAIALGGVLNYAVKVVNKGLSGITSVQLYINVAYKNTSGDVIAGEKRTYGSFNLASGEAKTSSSFTYGGATDTNGTLVIAATVIGVGALSNVISEKVEKSVEVYEPVG